MPAPANLFARPDTFLGACEALGRDTGIHPNLLRLAVALPLLWAPAWAAAGYAAMAVLALATRLAFPVRSVPEPAPAPVLEVAEPETQSRFALAA